MLSFCICRAENIEMSTGQAPKILLTSLKYCIYLLHFPFKSVTSPFKFLSNDYDSIPPEIKSRELALVFQSEGIMSYTQLS